MSDDRPAPPAAPVDAGDKGDARAFIIHRDLGPSIRDRLLYRLPEKESDEQVKLREAAAVVAALEHEEGRLIRAASPVPPETVEKLAKARTTLRAAATSSVRDGSAQMDPWEWLIRNGTIIAPYVDPLRCIEFILGSDIATVCVATMALGVGGHGYELECALTPEALAEAGDDTKAAVAKEKLSAERFFKFCNRKLAFSEIYQRTTIDEEICCYAGWELLRNRKDKICGIEPMRAWTMRFGQQSEPIVAEVPVQDENGEWTTEEMETRFDTIVQVVNGRYTWFKELGDPRFIDRRNGQEVKDPAEQQRLRAANLQANEVLAFTHYGVSGGINPYGVPRWFGVIFPAQTRRAAQEVNLNLMDNNAIPPAVVFVWGGQLTENSIKSIEDRMKGRKGRESFGDLLVIEAMPPEAANNNPLDPTSKANLGMKFQSMNDAFKSDGLFAAVRKDSKDDVRRAWRLPGLLVGDTDDYNYATVVAAERMAEQQVMQPERASKDFAINHRLFPAIGFKFWRFKTKGPQLTEAQDVSALLEGGASNGMLTVNEGRAVLSKRLGIPLPPIDADWANRPIPINTGLATLGVDFTQGDDAPAPIEVDDPVDDSPDSAPASQPDYGTGAGAGGATVAPDADAGDNVAAETEADEADAAAGTAPAPKTARRRNASKVIATLQKKNPGMRVWRVLVPVDELATAATVDGMMKLRQRIQDELTERGKADRE